MEMAAAGSYAKRRRSTAPESGEEHTPPPAAAADPNNTMKERSNSEEPHSQEPQPRAVGGEEEGVDHISRLPDVVLGDIISLLPTKDAARTQILSSRWRRLWSFGPLNLHDGGFPAGERAFASVVTRILAAHPGPGRRLSLAAVQLNHYHCPATMDAWLRCPALDNLQVLDFYVPKFSFPRSPLVEPPVSIFRFSSTLRVATISQCHLPDDMVEPLHFPHLRELALVQAKISDGSLHSIIAASPALECLLLMGISGLHCLRINSPTLRNIGVRSGELIIELEDAPSLERLLNLGIYTCLRVSAISAPKLDTLGCLYDLDLCKSSRLMFGTTVIEGLRVISLMTPVHTIKTSAINIYKHSLDMVINLMRCFPCLEKLYIQSCFSGDNNLWRRKHRNLIKCLDIRLKTVVLRNYRGIKSEINFATFFVMNARMLESMRFEGCNDMKNFIAEQHRLLQLEKRASRGARFYFTSHSYGCGTHIKQLDDLSVADPFECRG